MQFLQKVSKFSMGNFEKNGFALFFSSKRQLNFANYFDIQIMEKIQKILRNPDETARLAQTIAGAFELGDVIVLDGDLGTGKTLFVTAFTKALESSSDVTSPTYTIANFYNIEGGYLLHADVYRLSGIAEFRDLGLADFFEDSIILIEWGLKIADELEEYILIGLEYIEGDSNARKLTISCVGEEYAARFELLKQKLSNF